MISSNSENKLYSTIGYPSNFISTGAVPFTNLTNLSSKGNSITYNEWLNLVNEAKNDSNCKAIVLDLQTNVFMKSYSILEKVYMNELTNKTNNNNPVWKIYEPSTINYPIINNSNISVNNKVGGPDTNLSSNSININNDRTDTNVVCVTDNQGQECLNTDDLYHISKLPIVFKDNDEICLYDNNKIPVCIGKDAIQILSGTRDFKLKSINAKNPNQNSFLQEKTENISQGGEMQVNDYYNNSQLSIGRNLNGYGLSTKESDGTSFSFYIDTPKSGEPVESVKCATCIP